MNSTEIDWMRRNYYDGRKLVGYALHTEEKDRARWGTYAARLARQVYAACTPDESVTGESIAPLYHDFFEIDAMDTDDAELAQEIFLTAFAAAWEEERRAAHP